MQLRRQYREIEQFVQQMPAPTRRQLAAIAMREFASAAQSEFPHLYATPPEEKYSPWGSGTAIGLERARSENLQIRMRGLALWLSVAYHETRESPFAEQQALHRQVMRTVRALKETLPPEQTVQWMAQGEAARAA
jgi:hypothetical protein